jgi:hypothetical protein
MDGDAHACMRELAQARAELAAEHSRALIDPSFVRDRAMVTLYFSSAHVQIREIDRAASALAEAAELAVRNRSARLD